MPGATLHCYHGYFCGAGGASGAIPDAKPPHALGGVKAEVQLLEHRAGKAGYIAQHGADAYAQRDRQLTTRAKNGAATLTPAHRIALAHEEAHLIQALADGKGTKIEQAKMKAEATMLHRHLNRNQPTTAAKAQAAQAATPKTPKIPAAKGQGKAPSLAPIGKGAHTGGGHGKTGAGHKGGHGIGGTLLHHVIAPILALGHSAGGHSGGGMGGSTRMRASDIAATHARVAALRRRVEALGEG